MYLPINKVEGPLFGVDAHALHQEIASTFPDKQISEVVYVTGDGVTVYLPEAEAIALAHGSAEAVAAREQAALFADYDEAVEKHLDSVAAAKGYGSRSMAPNLSARAYAGYANQYQDECIAYGQWCAACYAYAYQVFLDVVAETRVLPTKEELIAELPAMVWPV